MVYNKFVVEVWLSLVEYYVRDVGAAGSNPVTSTIFYRKSPDFFGGFFYSAIKASVQYV